MRKAVFAGLFFFSIYLSSCPRRLVEPSDVHYRARGMCNPTRRP